MALSYAKPTLATLFSYISVTNTRRDKRLVPSPLLAFPLLFQSMTLRKAPGKVATTAVQVWVVCVCVYAFVCVYESLVACTIKSVTQVVIIQNIYAWMVALCPSLNPGTWQETRRDTHTVTLTHTRTHTHSALSLSALDVSLSCFGY